MFKLRCEKIVATLHIYKGESQQFLFQKEIILHSVQSCSNLVIRFV